MTLRRIEILVDTDMSDKHLEEFRLHLEKNVWEVSKNYRLVNPGLFRGLMVQANEVVLPQGRFPW